ncbi:MAG: IS4 family transposase [Candidatus Zixiibacteriota bacterium]|nr:MAG: IS4 family transposase [candidate division Zixibacteria bacterium]
MDYIKSILSSKEFIHKFRADPKHFTRRRKLSFQRLFLFLTSSRNRSMKTELTEFLEQMADDQTQVEKLNESAVFRARLKLCPEAFLEMNQRCLHFAEGLHAPERWNGFRLCCVDGTTLRLPNEPEIIEMFPPQLNPRKQPVGPPLARVSLLYDPINKLMLSASAENLHIAEIDQLRRLEFPEGDGLLLGDRHYAAFWVFHYLIGQGLDFCIRVPCRQRQVFQDFIQEGCEEKIVQINPGRAARKRCRQLGLSTHPLTLRLIRVELSSGEVELLITNVLDCQHVPASQFAELYHMRWSVEEKIKQLKFRLNVENWSGKTVWSVFQDLYSRLWTANLTVWMAHGVEELIDEKTKDCQYPYQINWTGALSTMKRYLTQLFFRSNRRWLLERVTELYLDQLSPIRVNRKYPRNHRKQKRQFFMTYKLCG